MSIEAREECPGRTGPAHALMAAGILSPDWASAFAAVPRSAFLPKLVWPFDMDAGRSVAVSRAEDPDAWARHAEADVPIVAPWGTHYGNGDAVVRLTVSRDGKSASGAFTGPVEFMKLRAQRLPPVAHSAYVTGSVADADESSTTPAEEEFAGERFGAQRFVLGLRVPDCLCVAAVKRDGARPVWWYGLTDRSWACVLFRDGDTARVWQSGPRRLWDEVVAAHRWWEERGRPGHERFGLTVTPEGQRAWLDDPAHSWPV